MTMRVGEDQILVTGLSLLTGLGLDLSSSWAGLLAGRSPIKRFSLFDPAGLATPFGVELPEGAEELFARAVSPRQRRQMTRGTAMAIVAAQMALADAGLAPPQWDAARVGVVVGATGAGYAPRDGETDPHRILRNMTNAPAAWISLKHKTRGPSFVVSTACSSGAYALHAARLLLAGGECDVAICGAASSDLNYPDVEGFASLLALAECAQDIETASRPFDKNRCGFVIGEGGAMLVLETREHAARRGARAYAEMPPPGLSSEAYNIVSPAPDGAGMAAAMERALRHAGLAPADVDYINAHGTSTPLNDLYETQAIKRVFGACAKTTPVSSTKSMTGHCLSAAAAVEAAICCLAIRDGMIPPTANLTTPDPELDLDYVPRRARKCDIRVALSNSFAFGGHNGVCIFVKPPDGARR